VIESPGTLYICATPIGNLEDVSIRLLKTLRQVDLIACEDTRHTIKLLNRYKINKPLTSYHQHSRLSKEDLILQKLQSGQQIALVSDAGTPAISDPGADLVKRALEAGIKVEAVPGPSALITALALSGLDTQSFVFLGFLPVKSGQRREILSSLCDQPRTMIFYEAPHRLLKTLADIEELLGGERSIAVARELTKTYEEIRRGQVSQVIQHFKEHEPRGEFTIVLEGKQPVTARASLDQVAQEAQELIVKGMDKKEAFKKKAREYGMRKSEIYKYYVDKYEGSKD
jgi:16S rRNA (cytidine1402-2'-O)-methyltransferase